MELVPEFTEAFKICFFFRSIRKEDMQPHAESLLLNLFQTLSIPGSQENEYIMKGMCFAELGNSSNKII